jgi:hypothetical protein
VVRIVIDEPDTVSFPDGRQRLGDRPHRPGHPGRRGAPAGAATFLGASLQFPGR